ncbi:MAG TPA: hypothetical protein VEA79_14190 [Phenylobacterium sp.]|nr:hypothetical protein [Phenylobacterium sp.]
MKPPSAIQRTLPPLPLFAEVKAQALAKTPRRLSAAQLAAMKRRAEQRGDPFMAQVAEALR